MKVLAVGDLGHRSQTVVVEPRRDAKAVDFDDRSRGTTDAYRKEKYERRNSGELFHADSIEFNDSLRYMTSRNRVVYGGGGIMPDIFVPIDPQLKNRIVTKLLLSSTFNNFIYNYYTTNKPVFNNYKNPIELVNKFTGMPQLWNDLSKVSSNTDFDMKGLNEKNKKEIELRILASFARFKWRSEGYYEVLNSKDKMIEKALEVFAK